MMVALCSSGCVQTQATLLGSACYAAVPIEHVHIYRTSDQVECDYEELALIHAQGDVTFTNEHQMIESARKRAAKLGANGLILTPIEAPGLAEAVIAATAIGSADRRGEMIAIRVSEPCEPVAGETQAELERRFQ